MATHEKFLILGSNSFSGATMADHLAAEGHDVLATSRSEESHPAFLPYKWQARPGRVRFKRIDHNHDLCALKALLARERPTHVVNFAAQSMVGESWLNPDHCCNTLTQQRVIVHGQNSNSLVRYGHTPPGRVL